MAKSKQTPETIAAVQQLTKQGLTPLEIAERQGVSRSTVSRILRNYEPPRGAPHPVLIKPWNKQLAEQIT